MFEAMAIEELLKNGLLGLGWIAAFFLALKYDKLREQQLVTLKECDDILREVINENTKAMTVLAERINNQHRGG